MAKRNRGRGQSVHDALTAELDERIDADPLMSADDKAATRTRAREHVREQRRKKAIDAEFDRQVKLAEREYEPNEQLVDVLIDLPKFAAFIRLDNQVFFHGLIYEVPVRVMSTMNDQMARSWEHQNEIDGRERAGDSARKPMQKTMRPGSEVMRLNSVADLQHIRGA